MRTQKVRVAAIAGGEDSEGGTYGSTDEMWKTELNKADPKSEEGWYGKGVAYWQDVPASVDGVLGGFGKVTDVDIKESNEFLTELRDKKLLTVEPSSRAADCGAGIGRISEGMLCRLFTSVDLVEPVGHFLDKARELLAGHNEGGSYLQVGLEDWEPAVGSYDVIWIQWVVGHLTDDDFVAFFKRCQKGLKPGGLVVLKENTCTTGFIVDKEDSSVTRSPLSSVQFVCSQPIRSEAEKGQRPNLAVASLHCIYTEYCIAYTFNIYFAKPGGKGV